MIKSGQRWRNWSGIVQATPQQVIYPGSTEEIVDAVRLCRRESRTLRVVGSGHSFTAVAASDDVLLSLDRMQGIVSVDAESCTAIVWAGTKLKALGELLHAEGLAQENLGDIDVQSIAGAISTGTHGTGLQFGNIATQVVGMTIVTGTAEVLTCTEQSHPELFKSLQISLGALAVIVQVTLRLRPAYKLSYESTRDSLSACLQRLDSLSAMHRHFELYWFPYAEPCQLKFMNETDQPVTSRKISSYISDVILENAAFGALSGICRRAPKLSATVSRICAATVPTNGKVEYSHRLFATQRLVRFNEMEYNLPVEAMEPVIREMREKMALNKYNVHFPIECRFAKGDHIWLSPAYERDSAYIAVHMYKGMPHEIFFADMEQIFLSYGGRPHWGKLHTLNAEQLSRSYPMWDSFQQFRAKLDPDGIFLNDYLRRVFAVS
ncbi:D-arabinono-1,4-lactone oxidase [Cohnella abietis]|uniref:FAD-binding oxidoreductase n=1 Tax=Cohnella abietis TaxID=2507935 RepID=A0A3T1DBL8_9BACL|nr:D-arabinono-1,4-lactone oxidase [Cohnella abietis]BBI35355.1 FAD-binding oxidoreductase [Cohnella abietis]